MLLHFLFSMLKRHWLFKMRKKQFNLLQFLGFRYPQRTWNENDQNRVKQWTNTSRTRVANVSSPPVCATWGGFKSGTSRRWNTTTQRILICQFWQPPECWCSAQVSLMFLVNPGWDRGLHYCFQMKDRRDARLLVDDKRTGHGLQIPSWRGSVPTILGQVEKRRKSFPLFLKMGSELIFASVGNAQSTLKIWTRSRSSASGNWDSVVQGTRPPPPPSARDRMGRDVTGHRTAWHLCWFQPTSALAPKGHSTMSRAAARKQNRSQLFSTSWSCHSRMVQRKGQTDAQTSYKHGTRWKEKVQDNNEILISRRVDDVWTDTRTWRQEWSTVDIKSPLQISMSIDKFRMILDEHLRQFWSRGGGVNKTKRGAQEQPSNAVHGIKENESRWDDQFFATMTVLWMLRCGCWQIWTLPHSCNTLRGLLVLWNPAK